MSTKSVRRSLQEGNLIDSGRFLSKENVDYCLNFQIICRRRRKRHHHSSENHKKTNVLRFFCRKKAKEDESGWSFNVDHTKVKYDAVIKENETYSSVLAMNGPGKRQIRSATATNSAGSLDIRVSCLGEGSRRVHISPTGDKGRQDIELFMAVRLDFVWLEIYVTYG